MFRGMRDGMNMFLKRQPRGLLFRVHSWILIPLQQVVDLDYFGKTDYLSLGQSPLERIPDQPVIGISSPPPSHTQFPLFIPKYLLIFISNLSSCHSVSILWIEKEDH
jgi:hypothetical protein